MSIAALSLAIGDWVPMILAKYMSLATARTILETSRIGLLAREQTANKSVVPAQIGRSR